MRILGGVAILGAVLFFVLALMSAMSVAHMQHQVDSFGGLDRWANDVTGQTQRNQAVITNTVIVGVSFGIGAFLLGGLGVVFIVASFLKGKVMPATMQAPPQYQQAR